VTLWDVGSGQALRPLQGHGYLVTDGAFSADGTLFVSASADGTAIVWDVATGKDLHTFGQRNVDAR
jgi:WD40 repeat protein